MMDSFGIADEFSWVLGKLLPRAISEFLGIVDLILRVVELILRVAWIFLIFSLIFFVLVVGFFLGVFFVLVASVWKLCRLCLRALYWVLWHLVSNI